MAKSYNDKSYLKLAKHSLLLFMVGKESNPTAELLKVIDQLKNKDDLQALYQAFAKRKGKNLDQWIQQREKINPGLLAALKKRLTEKKIFL